MSVIFINHYGEKYDNIRIPDSNNYAYKALTDVICSVFKCEEIGSVVDTIIQSRSGRETFTEIYILPCQYDFKKTALLRFKSVRGSHSKEPRNPFLHLCKSYQSHLYTTDLQCLFLFPL